MSEKPLTIESALKLEVFRRIPLTIFAGETNLSRSIRWVHPVEVPDIARFLTGGEMLLTAGLGIARDPEQQRRFIREISDAGASVLILELSGRAYSDMPDALVDEAVSRNFPLVGLRGELPFVEVSAQVHESLVDERVLELTTYERLNDVFMQSLLEGRDHVSFAEKLAAEVDHPVVLEDTLHQVVAYSGATAKADVTLTDWERHSRVLHDTATNAHGAAHAAGEPSECTRRAVILRGERWGWLHILHGTEPLDRADLYALDRAADAVAITLLGARESGAKAAQRQNALVNRLLLGDISGEAFVTRALRIGRDLRERSLVVVFVSKRSSIASPLDEALEELCRTLHVPSVVADIGDHTLAIIGLSRQCPEETLVEKLSTLRVRAGVSRQVAASQVPQAVEQARSAASVAAARNDERVLRFDELGVLRLLVSLAQGPELARYVEDELGPVLKHDANSASPLLPTLRAFLTYDGNKTHAAEALFVQRRTMYYRIDRLNQLLKRKLDDPDVRQALIFAVRGHDLMHKC
ncbi:PucR family transcriptional regulator [Rhodococcus sp. ACS1]|jgi:purine catabolism regulator|uniref:Purine catabolism regulatory protein n=2 Tax=Rhodococcus koreensis TaxID=99653 RepID=A0A1H4VL31_9NOCA|nr:PucR family transcriptional regulator ligand-binding domain-containing protein [Rhodococcus koreensis]PBC36628.1 PucR family transcriptional regulator [Rhodococcus sp. ACS1]QSE81172.1 PucR family transcriptional regulator ligand-binding domain-containing protein [Rhodococcus koreensis]SEC81550.1 purine catabolism regulatory protein [Rhodococcus koreensis]